MDRDDLELFERSIRRATETNTGQALDLALEEIGWRDALAIDPSDAVGVFFDTQGRANATSSALGQVALDALDLDVPADAAPVLPALGRCQPPGAVDGERVTVGGVASSVASSGPSVIVVAPKGDGHVAVTVASEELTISPTRGLDPAFGIAEVEGDAAATVLGPVDWPRVVRRCQLAVGHELVGASRTMLDLARTHALERVQFGVPIASFQAVRHRLAETLVAVEAAEAVLAAAWEDDSSPTAAMAKSLAGRGARSAARHAQQVLAGIGFTLEHDFHHYLRRVLLLDELFGSTRTLTKELGEALVATRTLPPILPL